MDEFLKHVLFKILDEVLPQNKITFVVEGEEVEANAVVLSVVSPYFKTMLTNDWSEKTKAKIPLENVKLQPFQVILDFLETGKMNLTLENGWDIYGVSKMQQIEGLYDVCEKYLLDQVDVDNCVKFFRYASHYGADLVKEKSLKLISDVFEMVSHKQDMKLLDKDCFVEILSLKNLQVQREEIVFRSVISWIAYDPKRSEDMHEVLKLIHLHKVSQSSVEQFYWKYKTRISLETAHAVIAGLFGRCAHSKRSTAEYSKVRPVSNSVCTIEIGNEWKRLHLPESERDFAVLLVGEKIYLAGGVADVSDHPRRNFYSGSLSQVFSDYSGCHSQLFPGCSDCHSYAPRWTKLAAMKYGRKDFSLREYGGCIYAIGGFEQEEGYVEKYSFKTKTWEVVV